MKETITSTVENAQEKAKEKIVGAKVLDIPTSKASVGKQKHLDEIFSNLLLTFLVV